ncbi:MAG: HD domain-containing protein [Prevotellaceae bacterium]|jgi:putative hydrolase of HD superfamily|nr:HD domain-containing protein [Prevotellaceae bacterium]
MHPREFISFMAIAEKLKCNTRHSWTSTGRPESVAEHTWRLSLMAYFIQDEFPEADINKVIQMCILHDLGEAITGDIPSFLKTEENESSENSVVIKLIKTLPRLYQDKLLPLFKEMNELQTLEAKLYKALDKLEAVMQHNEADISTWLPLEHELNIAYGEENVQFSAYLKRLKEELNKNSREKIKEAKR